MSAPDHASCGDITYTANDQGCLHLASVGDRYSGDTVGYAMSEHLTNDLVMQALSAPYQADVPA